MTIPDPPREDGWYRVTRFSWVPVTDEQAEAEIEQGGGWDLVRVKSVDTHAQDPLF